MLFKKTLLSTAVAATVGMTAMAASGEASAAVITMSWTGAFTMIDPAGAGFLNTAAGASTTYWGGWRTPVSGTMTLDTGTGAGTGTVAGFSFAANGFAVATTITMQAIGDGMGGPGTLVLGNMGFNWAGNNGIPVSIVLDAAGLFGALGSGTCGVSCTISGVGVLAESENTLFGSGAASKSYLIPLGMAPVATTDWNTTAIGTVMLGTNPSGTLPLVADTVVDDRSCGAFGTSCTSIGTEVGIGGSPMGAGPFGGWNANFDILTIHIESTGGPVVPIPAAAWLFGSGLLGLAAVARRKKKGDVS